MILEINQLRCLCEPYIELRHCIIERNPFPADHKTTTAVIETIAMLELLYTSLMIVSKTGSICGGATARSTSIIVSGVTGS